MPRKKEVWIDGQQAAILATANSGHVVSTDYIRLYSNKYPQRLRSRYRDGRTKEYLKSDVEKLRVRENRPRKPQILEQQEVPEQAMKEILPVDTQRNN